LLTYVGDSVVCRFSRNWFRWVGVVIESQVGCDVWYLLWRSWNTGFCSFGCCSGMSWLLWWNSCTYICSEGSRSDGVLMCSSNVIVSLMLLHYKYHMSHPNWLPINTPTQPNQFHLNLHTTLSPTLASKLFFN